MATDVPNQEPQLLLHLHDCKGGGHNYPITISALFHHHHHHHRTLLNFHITNKPTMSRRNGPKLDLKLNLSPPRATSHHHHRAESPSRSLTAPSPTSPPSSCVSSELSQQDECLRYSSSPEATSMMLVGCPRCLMYMMLAMDDHPRCPKCKSTVLLDVIHDDNTTIIKRTKNK